MFTASLKKLFTSVTNYWSCFEHLRSWSILPKVQVCRRWSVFQIYTSKYPVLTFFSKNKSVTTSQSIHAFQVHRLVRLMELFGIAKPPSAVMGKRAVGGFYAVARGKEVGIFSTWDECNKQVNGFPDAKFKKFPTEVEAQSFIDQHNRPVLTTKKISHASFTWAPGSRITSKPTGQPVMNLAAKTSSNSLSPKILPSTSKVKTTSSRELTTLSRSPQQKRTLKVTEDRVVNKRFRGDQTAANDRVDLSKFTVDEDGYVVVFTDGACSKNGRNSAKAGIGIWFGHNHPLNISEPVNGRQTNNTAEIQAAERAITQAKENGINKLKVKTDSQFTINCITKWMYNWRRNNWKLSSGGDVINKDDLIKLDLAAHNMDIKWSYVAGHAGIEGNEAADKLAVAGAERSTELN